MKKNILLYALLGLMAVVTSCSKTDETEKPTIPAADLAVWNKVQAFKARMANPLKDGDPLTVDSAVWYIETTLNCTYGDASYEFTDMHTDSAFTTLPVENGQVDMVAVTVAYNQLLDSIRQHYYGLAATDKQFVFANVELIPTGLKTSEVTLKVTSGVGEASSVSPANFGPGDDWMWGLFNGKCDGSYYNLSDAAEQIETKIKLVKAIPINYYYVDIESLYEIPPFGFPNPNYPTDPHPFLLFYSQYTTCISWEEMNYYLGSTKYVINTNTPNGLQPIGKSWVNFNLVGELIVSSGSHIHLISSIEYGFLTQRPPDSNEDL